MSRIELRKQEVDRQVYVLSKIDEAWILKENMNG